jgi:hypothetical protein
MGPAAVFGQAAWALLSALWNAAGVALIASGSQPTASMAGAVLLVAMAGLFPWLVRRWTLPYVALSVVAGALCVFAVWQAVTGDPNSWPSPFWRWAGAALNVFGSAACVAGVVTVFALKTTTAR